jgi:NAD(P)-dependent dehydrogenase (short-subunit alcohol dehydrogenase family)
MEVLRASVGHMVKDKVVVITGAGGGIGRDFALAFAARGAKVVVNDLGTSVAGEGASAGPAQKVAHEIRAKGGDAVASTDSVSDWESANRIVKTAIDSFGHLDCVVNNAGILRDRFFFNMSVEEWRAVIDVHLNGAFFVSRAAAPHFKSQGSGSYVHMTSTSGLIGNLGRANYSAAKLGIVGLSKNIAVDMQRFNVRSNCIAPVAWTRMTASIPPKDPAAAKRVEQRKQVTPEHNAPLAVFLASDAAKDVTGQVFSTRKNEIFLMSQSRPLRGIHRAEGWSPATCAEHMLPALKSWFFPLDRTADVFPWDSI